MATVAGDSYTLVVGEALIDIVTGPRGEQEHVGGSPLNVAAGLGRLGREVLFVSQFGSDPRGQAIVEHLKGSGVRITGQSITARPTSTAHATIGADGAASYVFDIHWALPPLELPTPPTLVHTGSIATVLDPGADAVIALFEQQHGQATLTFDPNVRPDLIVDAARGRERIEKLVALADVVKASDEDLRWYDPTRAVEDVARDWLERGPAVVAVTMGAAGAYAVCHAGELRAAPRPVTVVDTVGAGDAFMAGLVDALWELDLAGAERRDALRAVTMPQLREIVDTAMVNSALTVAKAGADLPTREQRDQARRLLPAH
jgi:fructokinase